MVGQNDGLSRWLGERPRFRVCLAACLTIWLAIGFSHVHARAQTANEFPPTERKEIGTKWRVKGRVTATNSRPLSGVKVYLTRGVFYQAMGPKRISDLQNPAVTDFGGNFEIDVKEGHLLVFVTSGFAPLGVQVPEGSAIEVQMETGRTITGMVTTPTGEPLSNAVVTPAHWYIPRTPTTNSSSPNLQPQPQGFYGGLPDYGKSWAVKTDANGKFSLPNMPSDYRIGLSIKSTGWKEEVIFVRPQDDIEAPYANTKVFENDFEYPVEPCSVLTINATDDSGTPSKISMVATHQNFEAISFFDFRRTETFDDPNIELSQPVQPQGSVVYVQPLARERLMGVRLVLPPNDDIELVEKEVTFKPGIPIRGRVVNDETGKPISDVQIIWIPKKPLPKDATETSIAAWEIKTDRNGEFAFAAPDVDATIGVSGNVDGYCSMPKLHQQREIFDEVAGEVFDRLTRELSNGETANSERIEFRLRPSYQVNVKVVDEFGRPAKNGVLAWSKKTNLRMQFHGTSTSSSHSSESYTKMTDSSGEVEIKHFYDDDFFLAVANISANKTNGTRSHSHYSTANFYPIAIQAFSTDGLKQGQATVPLPIQGEGNEIPLTINLLPGSNVTGQIIDHESNPIGELTIKARSGDHSAGQIWTTTTRSDGWFKMQGLPPKVKLNWSLDSRRVKAPKISIEAEQLVQGETLNIDPIVVFDYSMLADDIPDIEIGGLSNEAALEVLVAFIKDCHARIPQYKKEKSDNGFSLSPMFVNSRDPIPGYKDRVAEKAIPVIKELADREPASDFEMKLLVAASQHLCYQSGIRSQVGMKASNFRSYCYKRLLKNHVGRDETQVQLINMAAMMPAYPNRNKYWLELYNASPIKQTKAIVAANMTTQLNYSIVQACNESVSDTEFSKKFSEFDEYIARAEKHLADLPPEWRKRMQTQFKYAVNNLEAQLKLTDSRKTNPQPGRPKMNKSRLEKVAQRIAALTDELIPPAEGD